jgi:hypothetical protein
MPNVLSVTSSAINSGEAENDEKETIATDTAEKATNDNSETPAIDANEMNTPEQSSTSAEPASSNTPKQNVFISSAAASINPETPSEQKTHSSNTNPTDEGTTVEQEQTQQQERKVRPK